MSAIVVCAFLESPFHLQLYGHNTHYHLPLASLEQGEPTPYEHIIIAKMVRIRHN